MQGTKLESSQQSAVPWLCSFFQESGNAPPDGGASAFILPAAAAVALFWFCWYTVFSTGVFDHHHEAAHTHTPLKKKSGLPDPPTKPAKKKRDDPPEDGRFSTAFFRTHTDTRTHGHTDTHTHRKLKATGLNYCIKKNIQVSNNAHNTAARSSTML